MSEPTNLMLIKESVKPLDLQLKVIYVEIIDALLTFSLKKAVSFTLKCVVLFRVQVNIYIPTILCMYSIIYHTDYTTKVQHLSMLLYS